jgi:hypothetical protein
MAEFINIKDAIIDALEEIDGIKSVYGYEKGDLAGFPSACVIGAEFSSDWITNGENNRVYIFKIKLRQEIKDEFRGAEGGEDVLDKLTDSIIEAFEQDYTLGGLADKVFVKGAKAWETREIMMRVMEITLQVEKLVLI